MLNFQQQENGFNSCDLKENLTSSLAVLMS